jgi:two-component system alkaline phosphatase synthesis response regulator PhoP
MQNRNKQERLMANKKLILVIDDDPDIVDSIEAILTKNGFEVGKAMSGQEGIEAATSLKPDLILCDMMMERVDSGNKVAEVLRSRHVDVPIFLLSSIGQATASNIEIDKLGFNGVFQKPVNPDYLVSTIARILGS